MFSSECNSGFSSEQPLYLLFSSPSRMDDFLAMGFGADDIRRALKSAHGNLEAAMEILLGAAPPDASDSV